MSNGSPTAYLLWAILASLFLVFLVYHLWSYDRFNCLRWNAGRQPGAFKRIMTYTYVATLPLLVFYGVVMTVLKFSEGFIMDPRNGYIFPKPTILWTPSHRAWLLPAYFILSIAWALEIVTHLEELTFWLFMLHQGPDKRDWFDSWEVRVWYIGTMVSIVGLPLTVMITRKELMACEAWVFLVGSSASLATTLCFIYVLVRFPIFIRHVKAEGADPSVVVRLSTFYNLNIIRVVFRFQFTVPLLALAIDGVQGHHVINRSPFWCNFLLVLGGIGCFISSAITLLVFFPRSMTQEAGYRPKIPSINVKTSVHAHSLHSPPSPEYFRHHSHYRHSSSQTGVPRSPPSPHRVSWHYPLPPEETRYSIPLYDTEDPAKASFSEQVQDASLQDMPWSETSHASHNSYRHPHAMVAIPQRQPQIPSSSRLQPDLHPYVMTFTSPIDLFDASDDGHPYRGVV